MPRAKDFWPLCVKCRRRRVRLTGQSVCGACRYMCKKHCWGCGKPILASIPGTLCDECDLAIHAFQRAWDSFTHKRRPAEDLEEAIERYARLAGLGLPLFPANRRAG